MADPAVDPFAKYDTAAPAPTNDNAQTTSGPQVSQQLIPIYDQSGKWTGYRRAALAPGASTTGPDQAPAVAPAATPIEVKTAPMATPPAAPAGGASPVDPF